MKKTTYKQITSVERDWIGRMSAQGRSIREIASFLQRSPSTISREIRRNQGSMFGKRGYFSGEAHRLALKRFSETHKRGRLRNEFVLEYVEKKLKERWSPELIAGRLPMDHPGEKISHESIYQWIYTEAKEYIPFLARQRRTRKVKGYSRKPQKQRIPSLVRIDERPKDIEERKEVGHWEVDTVGVDKYRPTLQVLIERKTRYAKVQKLVKNDSNHAKQAIVKSFWNTPSYLVKTFTYDNGPENCGHQYVNYKLKTKSYFCHPYHSWERGSVENVIGLIRRIYPKKTRFDAITPYKVRMLQYWLNHRPRKCLGFRTPFEAFKAERCCT